MSLPAQCSTADVTTSVVFNSRCHY